MPALRVRSGADIHLADAFDAPGCPLCRERSRTEAAYLESILAESVNDVGFRADLDAARGFCARHAAAVLDADRARAGSLAASILLRATLVVRLRDVEAAAAAGGWSRSRKVADATRQPACPACARTAVADERSVETVVRLSEDAAWAEAVRGAPVCLDHLLALMAVRPVPHWWPAVEAAHVERLRSLAERLDAFAHASSHDRRHLQTDDQRASVDEAAAVLAGWQAPVPPATRSPEREAGERSRDAPAADRPSPGTTIPGEAQAVLLAGVYGAGKTTLAVELADRLDAAGVPVAAMDLDWLAWYAAPVDWDEHADPRLTLRHLEALSATYLDAGVTRLILAGALPVGSRPRVEAAIGIPLTVIRLEVGEAVVRRRLAHDPNASRADDLARALASLRDPAVDEADWVVDADGPVGDIAVEVLERLGWLPK
jgi:adenylylsulfate kinase